MRQHYFRATKSVRAAMKEAGISPEVLADQLGYSRATIYNWTQGKHKVHKRVAEQFALLLDKDLALLFDVVKSKESDDAPQP